jgi:hypothetical protein
MQILGTYRTNYIKSGQIRIKNKHLASLVEIRDILCRIPFVFLDGPLLFLAVVLALALVLSVLELICHACDKKEPGVTAGAIFARDLVSKNQSEKNIFGRIEHTPAL